LYEAAQNRDAGFSAGTSLAFPIPRMDKAMGLGKSCSAAGAHRGITASSQRCAHAVSVHDLTRFVLFMENRSRFHNPAYFPIMFELTVLLSAFTTVFALISTTNFRNGITALQLGAFHS